MKYLLVSILACSIFSGCDDGVAVPDGVSRSEITDDGTFASARRYYSPGPDGCSEPEYSCATELVLCPDGRADWFAGGDIIFPYEYVIDGNDLVLTGGYDDSTLVFTIVGNDTVETLAGSQLPRATPSDYDCGADDDQ